MLMLKIGRYGIVFGRVLQTNVPTRFWHFLCLWLIRETRLTDIDKKQQFPLGTIMTYRGKNYYYIKAGEDIIVSKCVEEKE